MQRTICNGRSEEEASTETADEASDTTVGTHVSNTAQDQQSKASRSMSYIFRWNNNYCM
jgi:hypothetical protein